MHTDKFGFHCFKGWCTKMYKERPTRPQSYKELYSTEESPGKSTSIDYSNPQYIHGCKLYKLGKLYDICRKIYVLEYTYIWNNRENKAMNSNESGERYMEGFRGNKCKE